MDALYRLSYVGVLSSHRTLAGPGTRAISHPTREWLSHTRDPGGRADVSRVEILPARRHELTRHPRWCTASHLCLLLKLGHR